MLRYPETKKGDPQAASRSGTADEAGTHAKEPDAPAARILKIWPLRGRGNRVRFKGPEFIGNYANPS